MEKKLAGYYTRMLQAILNKSWRQHPTKQLLYNHLPPITKTIKVRRTRHAGHCWRSKDELISDVLLWTPSHGWAKAGGPARTYLQQICADMRYDLEDLLEVMDDREGQGYPWWWCDMMMRRYIWFVNKSTKLKISKFSNNSIKHQTFVYTQLNDPAVLFQTIQFSISQQSSKYCYISLTIQIRYQSFIYTQLNDQTVLFLTVQFSISQQS